MSATLHPAAAAAFSPISIRLYGFLGFYVPWLRFVWLRDVLLVTASHVECILRVRSLILCKYFWALDFHLIGSTTASQSQHSYFSLVKWIFNGFPFDWNVLMSISVCTWLARIIKNFFVYLCFFFILKFEFNSPLMWALWEWRSFVACPWWLGMSMWTRWHTRACSVKCN